MNKLKCSHYNYDVEIEYTGKKYQAELIDDMITDAFLILQKSVYDNTVLKHWINENVSSIKITRKEGAAHGQK